MENKPEYAIRFEIVDKNTDEVIATGTTYLHNEKRSTMEMGMELLQEESAETEMWGVLRHFRNRQPAYEKENYPHNAALIERLQEEIERGESSLGTVTDIAGILRPIDSTIAAMFTEAYTQYINEDTSMDESLIDDVIDALKTAPEYVKPDPVGDLMRDIKM